MKATELVQQYHAKTITARELVEGVWDNAATRFDEYGRWLFFTNNALYHAFFADSLEELYAKGAEFTISRIEEIRQVKEEIALLRGLVILLNEEPGDLSTPAWLRVITREHSALAELSRGIRPEAL